MTTFDPQRALKIPRPLAGLQRFPELPFGVTLAVGRNIDGFAEVLDAGGAMIFDGDILPVFCPTSQLDFGICVTH
jgi:hypothetical protein